MPTRKSRVGKAPGCATRDSPWAVGSLTSWASLASPWPSPKEQRQLADHPQLVTSAGGAAQAGLGTAAADGDSSRSPLPARARSVLTRLSRSRAKSAAPRSPRSRCSSTACQSACSRPDAAAPRGQKLDVAALAFDLADLFVDARAPAQIASQLISRRRVAAHRRPQRSCAASTHRSRSEAVMGPFFKMRR